MTTSEPRKALYSVEFFPPIHGGFSNFETRSFAPRTLTRGQGPALLECFDFLDSL